MISAFVVWDVDPALIRIGSFEIRYYAVAWLLAFIIGQYIVNKMLVKEKLDKSLSDSLFMYSFIGCLIGARLGHCLFYDFDTYISNPLSILNIREGGLASHGAAVGIILGLWLFSRKYKMSYMWTLDRVTAVVPIGGGLIRLGNLINSEIYGTQTDAPWGFIFVRANETLPMHPTQIYEAIAYFILFVILMWLYFKKDMGIKYPGFIFGTCLFGTFFSRIIIEIIKNPQVMFEENMVLNMGQILSIPFVALGLIFMILSLKGKFKTQKK